MSRNNELHINIDKSSMNLLEEMNEKYFDNKVKLKELIRYCIQMAYIYNKKIEDFEDRNFY